MTARQKTQQARFQVSTALVQEDYDALHMTQAKHGVNVGDILREGIRSYNSKVAISEVEMIRVIKEGIKAINKELQQAGPSDTTPDLTDTTPPES